MTRRADMARGRVALAADLARLAVAIQGADEAADRGHPSPCVADFIAAARSADGMVCSALALCAPGRDPEPGDATVLHQVAEGACDLASALAALGADLALQRGRDRRHTDVAAPGRELARLASRFLRRASLRAHLARADAAGLRP